MRPSRSLLRRQPLRAVLLHGRTCHWNGFLIAPSRGQAQFAKSIPTAPDPIPDDPKRLRCLLSREDTMKRLRGGDEYDILVIGGGCAGAGAALDAATRGLKVRLEAHRSCPMPCHIPTPTRSCVLSVKTSGRALRAALRNWYGPEVATSCKRWSTSCPST